MLDTLKKHLRYTSWPIIVAMIALMSFGLLAINVSEQADPAMRGLANRQIVWACVGLGIFIGATIVPYRRFGRLAYPLFAGTLLLLIVVLFLPEIRYSHRWIDLKVVRLQPSEIAKLTYILLLGRYLRYGDNYRKLRGLIVPFVLTFVPMGLILIEPDLGTSLLFVPILYFMLFMAGAKLRHLLGIVAVATAIMFVPVPRKISPQVPQAELLRRQKWAYWTFQAGQTKYVVSAAPLAIMKHHQIQRLEGWVHQGQRRVSWGAGYQLLQSKMVLGSGQITGRGDWEDADLYFYKLPDDHTDFIFSIIGGQWGFAGCLVLLGLYGVIFLFGAEIATVTNDPFGRLLAVGVLAMLLTQVFINVGMTMGLMPITGMTLPLVSYGGSSLVVNCAALGLLINVGQRRPILLAPRPFEHGQKKQKPPVIRCFC